MNQPDTTNAWARVLAAHDTAHQARAAAGASANPPAIAPDDEFTVAVTVSAPGKPSTPWLHEDRAVSATALAGILDNIAEQIDREAEHKPGQDQRSVFSLTLQLPGLAPVQSAHGTLRLATIATVVRDIADSVRAL